MSPKSLAIPASNSLAIPASKHHYNTNPAILASNNADLEKMTGMLKLGFDASSSQRICLNVQYLSSRDRSTIIVPRGITDRSLWVESHL